MAEIKKRRSIEEANQVHGMRIKYLRIKAGYPNATAFAKAQDLSVTSYQRWEKGTNMMMGNLLLIMVIHDVSMYEFYTMEIDSAFLPKSL